MSVSEYWYHVFIRIADITGWISWLKTRKWHLVTTEVAANRQANRDDFSFIFLFLSFKMKSYWIKTLYFQTGTLVGSLKKMGSLITKFLCTILHKKKEFQLLWQMRDFLQIKWIKFGFILCYRKVISILTDFQPMKRSILILGMCTTPHFTNIVLRK